MRGWRLRWKGYSVSPRSGCILLPDKKGVVGFPGSRMQPLSGLRHERLDLIHFDADGGHQVGVTVFADQVLVL